MGPFNADDTSRSGGDPDKDPSELGRGEKGEADAPMPPGGEVGRPTSRGGLDDSTLDVDDTSPPGGDGNKDPSEVGPGEKGVPDATESPSRLQPQVCALIVLHFAACFFFGGIIFGWGPLQLLLEEDQVYQYLCPEGVAKCNEQEQQLVLMYTIGVACGFVAELPLGVLVDKAGPRVSGTVSGAMLGLGFFLLGCSEHGGLEAFRLSMVLITIGGFLAQLNSFPLGSIVPVQAIPFVMTGINCFFDASTVINWLLQQIYQRTNIGRQSLFVAYAVFSVALNAVLVLLWCGAPAARLQAAKNRAVSSTAKGAMVAAPPLHGLPFLAQLRTFEFAFTLLFACIQIFRTNLYLGVNKELLERLGDSETGHAYIGAFSLLLPASVVCIPVFSWIMRRSGYAGTFLATIITGACWNAVVLVPSLPLQPVAFVAFSIFRALLYSGLFAFTAQTFGPCTSARVQGLMFLIVAGTSLLIWPSLLLVNKYHDGNPWPLFAAMLALLIPLAAMLPELRRRLKNSPAADCRDTDRLD